MQLVQNDEEEIFEKSEKTSKNDDIDIFSKLMRQSNINSSLEMILTAYTYLISKLPDSRNQLLYLIN